ncbi:organic cation transporter protein-like [Anabrus simplex]|uniref:organic cation transporter protein-like n=1 Tax=Anabrus simplex TaxID=316456 RepID=UPI0035A32DCF
MPPQEKIVSQQGAPDENRNSVASDTDMGLSFKGIPEIIATSPSPGEEVKCVVGDKNLTLSVPVPEDDQRATLSVEQSEKKLPPSPTPSRDGSDKLIDFDDVLPHMGEFGLYQKILFVLLAPFAFFVAFVYFAQIFITITPEHHWCKIPALMGHNLSHDARMRLSIPRLADGSYDKCHMFDVDYAHLVSENVTNPSETWPVVPCRHGWEFDLSDIPYLSISAEYEWVCDNSALPSVATAVFFCGAILGGLIFGWVADRYGRIPALVGTNAIGFAAGVATCFVTNFWQFCICRFLVGLAFDNCFTMMYILVLEYVGPKWRTFVANMSIALYFTLASCILPWLAYFIADWRMLCVATSAPLLLAIITPCIVPESARWLVSQGKIEQAIVIMKKFERINGTKVDPNIYQQFSDSCYKIQKEEEHDKTYSVLDLFRTPRMRNITLLLIVIWMAISLCFDGHVRNVESLGLNVFITFTVASATELPADTFLTMVLDRWGRRWLACGSMVISGVFSLLASAVPTGAASASLAILGRFSVNISYNIGLQYAAELLPTVVRAQGVALIHIMGYVATIISPFIVYLSIISPIVPLIVLGAIGIFGGALSLYLPETLDQELPQTLQDGENFGRGQKFLDFPCCMKPPSDDVTIVAEEPPSPFQRGHKAGMRASLRASIRGETYRSSMLQRSVRSRRGVGAAQDTASSI